MAHGNIIYQDTYGVRVALAPVGSPPSVETEMIGRDSGGHIPVIRFADPQAVHVAVEIALGNCDDPSGWLRETAARLLSLAEDVDGAALEPVQAVAR